MKNKSIYTGVFLLIGIMITNLVYGQNSKQKFEFQFENKTLRGLIEYRSDIDVSALIIIIPGSGRTNFVKENWWGALRENFVNAGVAVCVWDKMGCGGSEGEFDNQQPVDNSAKEAIAAINELKRLKITGSRKIGLWGISRAGYICPLIINQYPIDFWISVNATSGLDSYRYLLESNWRLQDNSDSTLQVLLNEWDFCNRTLVSENVNYDNFIANTKNLYSNSFFNSLGGVTPTEDEIIEYQQYSRENNFVYDSVSGLQIMVENFSETLRTVNCPVLAIFGKNDTQVDWRKTMALYKESLNNNSQSIFAIKTFENCNHNMQKCETGALGEDLKPFNWIACDGYYEAMNDWLKMIEVIE